MRTAATSEGSLETPFDDREPSWSPDCEFLVFSRYSEDSVEIWTVNKDGTGFERLPSRAP
jgi:Tol biopolymer transport system component